jgi:hypothetical protein
MMEPAIKAGGSGEDSSADYLEAIALLQEEVARLEQEVRARDERSFEPMPQGAAGTDDALASAAAEEEVDLARAEVQRLKAELAGSEETIGLLVDQLSRVEEAQAASRAEWEQLAGWLTELEQRVERQDAQRDASGCCPDSQLVAAHRTEDLRLRAGWDERPPAPAAESSQTGDPRLAESLQARDALRRQLEQVQDERRREQLEHTARVAELQAQVTRAALARPEEPPPQTDRGAAGLSHERDVELRFRALREHLLEIHQQEAEERKRKQLIPRLARLWGRTGPR